MKDIEILMKDKCTKKDAERHLKNGTVIYDNPEEYFHNLKDCGCYDGETIDQARSGQLTDVSVVEYDGHEYLIAYAL